MYRRLPSIAAPDKPAGLRLTVVEAELVMEFGQGNCSLRGELGGNRTHDPRLKRALLYQLSYELV